MKFAKIPEDTGLFVDTDASHQMTTDEEPEDDSDADDSEEEREKRLKELAEQVLLKALNDLKECLQKITKCV